MCVSHSQVPTTTRRQFHSVDGLLQLNLGQHTHTCIGSMTTSKVRLQHLSICKKAFKFLYTFHHLELFVELSSTMHVAKQTRATKLTITNLSQTRCPSSVLNLQARV